MSRKRQTYSAQFKAKLVLEVLRADSTLNEIASRNNILPKNLANWKQIFLSNAELAMEPSKAVKEYKDENKELHKKIDKYAKTVGKMTVENEWLTGKLKSLDLSIKREIVDVQAKNKPVSLSRQTELLAIGRGHFYYQPVTNTKKKHVKNRIRDVFNEIPIYGEKKVHQQLLEDGFDISLNTVSKYRKEMGFKAVLAVKPVTTTKADKQHPKHSYKLRNIDINHSKAVLSWKISNCMDTDLVMGVLNESLNNYGTPDIFNTDQGSQYTSYVHTQALKDRNITISMDGKGRATDNIAIERFWRSAKCEIIYLNEYNGIKELKDDIKDYIEFYNTRRFHETLNYKKPMDVYFENLKGINKIKLKRGA